jgi:hypothetical protein
MVMVMVVMAGRTGGRMVGLSAAGFAGVAAAGAKGNGSLGEVAGQQEQLLGKRYGCVQVGEHVTKVSSAATILAHFLLHDAFRMDSYERSIEDDGRRRKGNFLKSDA